MRKVANNNINYQERAREFQVGDVVVPYGSLDSQAGRVVAVWPGIGMVDVELALASKRYPVETLTRVEDHSCDPPYTDSVPGSKKTAIYWADKDRKYRLKKNELAAKTVFCPRCCPEVPLKKATYVRDSGISDHLLGCPQCMFLIKFVDILNHWKWSEEEM